MDEAALRVSVERDASLKILLIFKRRSKGEFSCIFYFQRSAKKLSDLSRTAVKT